MWLCICHITFYHHHIGLEHVMIALQQLGRHADIYTVFEEAVTQHGIIPTEFLILRTCQSFIDVKTPPATLEMMVTKLCEWRMLKYAHVRALIQAAMRWQEVPFATRMLMVQPHSRYIHIHSVHALHVCVRGGTIDSCVHVWVDME